MTGTKSDFADLMNEADAVDAAAGVGMPPGGDDAAPAEGEVLGPELSPEELRKNAAESLTMLVWGAAKIWPELSEVYDDAVIEEGAEKLANLMQRPWWQRWFGSGSLDIPWKAEVEAALFFGAAIAGGVGAVKAARQPRNTDEPQAGHVEPGPAKGSDRATGTIFDDPAVQR